MVACRAPENSPDDPPFRDALKIRAEVIVMNEDPKRVAELWVDALTRHDLDTAVGCFAADYSDLAPARRGETVQGRERVRENFVQLFASIPDLRAEILSSVADRETVWVEWRMRGTRAGGTRMEFVGVNLFGVEEGRFRWGRIYTELVRDAGDVDAQIDRMTHGGVSAPASDEIIRDLFKAYADGDAERLRELLDPNVIYHVPGRSPMAGDYEGRNQVLALWDRQKRYMGGKPYRVKEVAMVTGGDHVVLLTEVTAARDGRQVTFRGANSYRVEDGRVVEGRVFIFDLEGFDAFWAAMPARA